MACEKRDPLTCSLVFDRDRHTTGELIRQVVAVAEVERTRRESAKHKIEEHIPFLGALLKNEQDTENLESFSERGGKPPNKWADLGPRYNQ